MKNEQKILIKKLAVCVAAMVAMAIILSMGIALLVSVEVVPESASVFLMKMGNLLVIYLAVWETVRKLDKNKMQYALMMTSAYIGLCLLSSGLLEPKGDVKVDLWVAAYVAAGAAAAMTAATKRQRKR